LTGSGGGRPSGALRLGHRTFGPDQLLVMAVVEADLARVRAAVAEGADIVAVRGGPGDDPLVETTRVSGFVSAVRDAHPELVIAVEAGRYEVGRAACAAGADLVRGDLVVGDLVEVAAQFGAGVVCSPVLVARAVGAGVDPQRIVVESAPAQDVSLLAGLVASGWPVLVDEAADNELAGALARTAVCAWLGARVFRVGRVLQTRRVLRMVSAIRGDIPPARAVRGLA